MRVVVFIFLLNLSPFRSTAQMVSITRARSFFEMAPLKKEAGMCFLELTAPSKKLPPLLEAYRGAIMMVMARHFMNPFTKWQYFSEGKVLLESAIRSDPNNLEMIFLRLSIQQNAPAFLGYNSHIESDLKRLSQHIHALMDKPLQEKILAYLKGTPSPFIANTITLTNTHD